MRGNDAYIWNLEDGYQTSPTTHFLFPDRMHFLTSTNPIAKFNLPASIFPF